VLGFQPRTGKGETRSERLYDLPTYLIAILLFIAMLGANSIGRRLGSRQDVDRSEGQTSQTNATVASILGLLALLLGFTFTMALQRFDARSDTVLQEANAIGTAYLRTQLLPGDTSPAAEALFRQYIELRIEMGRIDLTHPNALNAANSAVKQIQQDLWSQAVRAADLDPSPTRTGLFVQALNEMIDQYGARVVALEKHIPEFVFFLLFAITVMAEGVLGYAGGLANSRPIVAILSFSTLIALVIFLIVDLDRPRRGFVEVDQSSLRDLTSMFDENTGPSDDSPSVIP
jgi:hypothetical protein